MELIKIILEQSTVDYSDWKSQKPGDYDTDPSKYRIKFIKINNKPVMHYKLIPSSPPSTNDLLDEYVGKYKITSPAAATVVTVEIVLNGNKLIIKYGRIVEEELTPSSNTDEFTFEYSGKNTITFKRDTNGKVNGFNGVIFSQNVVGEKAGSSSSAGTSGTSGTAGSSGSAGSSGTSSSSGTPTVVQYTKYNAITPEDRIKDFRWHDCQNKDFPYEYGCKHNKIGQMNQCLFGSELNDIFGNDLWEKMTDMAFSRDKKEITLDMYNEVMSACKQQEESIERKKIIKENTYKILKQLK